LHELVQPVGEGGLAARQLALVEEGTGDNVVKVVAVVKKVEKKLRSTL
jgi:hypothetical protein